MNRLQWIMRAAERVDTVPVRNGHRVEINLTCGHVIVWKLSRFKTYTPKRWRCSECQELLGRFLGEHSAPLVERMEGIEE